MTSNRFEEFARTINEKFKDTTVAERLVASLQDQVRLMISVLVANEDGSDDTKIDAYLFVMDQLDGISLHILRAIEAIPGGRARLDELHDRLAAEVGVPLPQ